MPYTILRVILFVQVGLLEKPSTFFNLGSFEKRITILIDQNLFLGVMKTSTIRKSLEKIHLYSREM